jgi:protein-disulfide isomerase
MTRLIVFASVFVVAAACNQDTKNLEKKIDAINQKLDRLAQGGIGGGQARPQRPPEPDRGKTYAVAVDNDPFDGPADAKVTLVKAYDYQCPFCEKVRDTMEDLKKKYGPDLRIVYKQLVVHPRNATAGALAFCAAAKQGKQNEMDKLLWDKGFKERQADLSEVPADQQAEKGGQQQQPQRCWDLPGGCTNVVGFASQLGMDVERFKADMRGDCQKLIEQDRAQLSALGVSATPAFFVNGRYLSGAMPIENFVQLIDEELKKANERIAAGTPPSQYYQQFVIDKGLKSLSGG